MRAKRALRLFGGRVFHEIIVGNMRFAHALAFNRIRKNHDVGRVCALLQCVFHILRDNRGIDKNAGLVLVYERGEFVCGKVERACQKNCAEFSGRNIRKNELGAISEYAHNDVVFADTVFLQRIRKAIHFGVQRVVSVDGLFYRVDECNFVFRAVHIAHKTIEPSIFVFKSVDEHCVVVGSIHILYNIAKL